MKAFERNFWVLVKPADDVPGQWVGHCLELDIVSVGNSLQGALEMTSEAVCDCIADDLIHERSPLDRRPAAPEFYTELTRVLSTGRYIPAAELPTNETAIAAVQVHVNMHVHVDVQTGGAPRFERGEPWGDCMQKLPPAWMMDRYNSHHRLGVSQ